MCDRKECKNPQNVKLQDLKPHFLFNALNSIKCEVILDAQDKIDLIDDFAAYLRYIMRFSDVSEDISAKEIFSFLHSYVRLEKARYDQIEVLFEMETLHFVFDPLALFEIVYHAIHHGLGGNAPGGKVWIRIRKREDKVCIEVQDNGKGFDTSKSDVIIDEESSLYHIQKKMEQRGATFQLKSEKEQGTLVQMELKEIGE